ncbi:hypothetical protein ABVK25_010142 [Lepraria finkii]|uniref:Uncharacterized protein n=1 Tax=Lepraria finkii TaxID=1340010 RepID=A0ABR4AWP9_9LECA
MAQPNPSSTCSVDTAKRTNIPWKTNSYDDEAVLLNVRLTYPQAEWSAIADTFNKAVPVQRARSEASVACKGRSLLKVRSELKNALEEVIRTHGMDSRHPDLHEKYPPSPAEESRQDRALHIDSLYSFWDGSFDSQGYSALVLEMEEQAALVLEMEGQAALEAAAGIRRR